MEGCRPQDAPINKGDKFSKDQCPRNEIERKQMDECLYVVAIGNSMYAQTCTRTDISFAVRMLSRYQSDPSMAHWKGVKKVQRSHLLMYHSLSFKDFKGHIS